MMARHTDDQIEQAERPVVLPDDITAKAIHRLSRRVIELEASNAALLAACEAMLATWGTDDEDAVIESRRLAETAIADAKGGKR